MNPTFAALAFGALIMPGLALAQSSDTATPADTTPAPLENGTSA